MKEGTKRRGTREGARRRNMKQRRDEVGGWVGQRELDRGVEERQSDREVRGRKKGLFGCAQKFRVHSFVIIHTVRNYSLSDHGNEERQKKIHCEPA